jgi:uncharacterized membrane protein
MLALAVLLMLAGVLVNAFTHRLAANEVRLSEVLTPGLALGNRLMALGVLVLGLTPIFRVLTLSVLWARARDWRFFFVAVAVLIVLSLAILCGGG